MEVNFDTLFSADTVEKLDAVIQFLEAELANGNGQAGYMLAITFSTGNVFLSDELKEHIGLSDDKALHYYQLAFAALSKAAERGDGAAMHLIALYYQSGIPPVTYDIDECIRWVQRAFDAGYLHAANDLYSYYNEKHDIEKAAHYFKILEDAHMRCVTRYPWGEDPLPS